MAIIYSKESDGIVNAFVTGKVSREPETKPSKNGEKVKFSVAYGKKKYMQIESWSDSDVGQMALCVEKGDIVGVTGVYDKWTYNDKEYSAVTADAIFLMGAPVASSAPAPKEKPAPTQFKPGKFNDIEPDDEDDELPFE